MQITIISSSVREGRTSHRVALALKSAIKPLGHEAIIIDLKELSLPPFSERLAFMKDKPDKLVATSEILKKSNAIIFVTPEYNGSIPSSLKNFIDVFGKAEFAGKPMGVATASNGIMGGVRAAYQLQQIILALQAYPQPQMLLTLEVTKQLNEQGELINPAFQTKLDLFVNSFLGFASRFISEEVTDTKAVGNRRLA
jgi:NAD(P)H-dependent FMN reductase